MPVRRSTTTETAAAFLTERSRRSRVSAQARRKRGAQRADWIAERLVFALHIYAGHRIDSRGPSGCIMDVLDEVAPRVAKEIRDGGDLHDLYARRWGSA